MMSGSMGGMSSMSSAVPSGPRGPLSQGWMAAFGTGGYEDEPPLLEELGVNFGHIRAKVWPGRSGEVV